MSFLYYLLPDHWLTLFIVMGEWTGFVIIAYQIAKRTSLWVQFPVTFFVGGLWIFTWDYLCWGVLLHYGLIGW